MATVEVSRLWKTYPAGHALRGVDLAVEDGHYVVVVGPSGAGKSSLLRLIAGLEAVTTGRIRIGDRNVTDLEPGKRGVSMVFQSYALYPHMTAYHNMAFGLKSSPDDPRPVRERVLEMARLLEIERLLTRLPRSLSGGQRQRVAMARALLRQPDVLLLDEPLSSLDAALRVRMRVELGRLQRHLQTTVIHVTHDQVEAMTLADVVVVMREGCVEQIGPPLALYHHPVNYFVAMFLGSPSMNMLRGRVSQIGQGYVTVQLAGGQGMDAAVTGDGLVVGMAVEVGIRAEAVNLLPPGTRAVQATPAVVRDVQLLGDSTIVMVGVAGQNQPVAVLCRQVPAVRPGDAVAVQIPSSACHLFRPDGRAAPRLP